MRVCVLGSAASGGVPQWNCGCTNCHEARAGSGKVKPRTQDSAALSAGANGWFLLNASPDLRGQVERTPALWPRGPRESPILGVVLTSGDLDRCLGLFSMRESHRLSIYATRVVRRGITENNMVVRSLQRFPGQTVWHTLEIERPERLLGPNGEDSGLEVVARAVPGKPPIHLAGLSEPSEEDNIGVWARDMASGRVLAYVPSAGALGRHTKFLNGVDCAMFDGTFWSDDEMPRQKLGEVRARETGHMPVGGAEGSLEALRGMNARRRLYTHINNSNPMLLEGSEERREVARAGWELAEDGMDFEV
ncbi:MAG TPA: pyrroloquinoline quinone biosynthesis protein PqqB [Polyangiaceae bacterium]|nr:pyrroloquinoline quinone biosynthesis protein PqqB [Polyangiaceae bacterium]